MTRRMVLTALLWVCGQWASAGTVTAGAPQTAPATAAAAVNALADELLSYWQRTSASVRFQSGLPIETFDPVTLERARQKAQFSRDMLARLDRISLDGLPHAQWLLARTIHHQLRNDARAAESYWFDFGVTPYAGGDRIDFAQTVLAAQPLKTADDLEHYLRLLEAYAVMCDQVAAKTRAQAERNIRVSKPAIAGVTGMFEKLRAGAIDTLAPAPARLAGLPSAQAQKFDMAVRRRIDERIIPAYTAITGIFDEEYRRRAPQEVGVSRYPGGKEHYLRLIAQIGVTLAPREIHELGERRVAELDAQMQAVRDRIGFRGSREAFNERLLEDPRFLPRTPQEMGERLLAQVERMEPHLPAYFPKIPKARYGVKALDAALEEGQTFGFYSRPTPADPVGYYHYNGSNLSNRSLFAAAHLMFHELLPGHHLQVALQLESTGTHPVRRFMGSSAFSEGWAEYAASLGKEMGLYADPYDLYGQLAWESFFAVRLVVDTGMNYFDWPLERARAYMKAHVLNSEAEIASETLRYSTDIFGQALNYRLGYEKFWELRRRAEQALGAHFDIRAFHAAAIGEGSMPLDVLEEQIDWFIAQQRVARTLRLEDYLDLETVERPQISPDGKTIVYSRSRVNAAEDRTDSELWVMDADGGRNRRLMKGGSEVRWSPDGTRIAYLESTDRGNEIFVRWMDAAGSTSQITHEGAGPGYLRWSPDGRWIAFTAHVAAAQKWTVQLPDGTRSAHRTADAVVVDKLHSRLDGTVGGYTHIFVVPAEGGTPKQLTSGEWHAQASLAGMPGYRGQLEWTPDGRSIVFGGNMESDGDLEYGRSSVNVVDVADGRIRTLTKAEGFWGIGASPRISPDGRRIAYIGTQASNTSNYPSLELHVMNADGSGDHTLIPDLRGAIGHLEWARNGRMLYYGVSTEGGGKLCSVSLSGEIKAIPTGAQSLEISSVSESGIAVGTANSAYRPADIVRLDLKDGRDLRILTAVNEDVLGDVRLGRVEEIWYDSSDHTRVQGWIVYPPDFDAARKYPLILDIHGGPENMAEGTFQFTYQDMAANGYVVLYTNPRGSTGYGGEFTRAIYNAWPGRADYDDLMHGVDAVLSRGFVDTERLYVQGCSAGGTMAAWIVTQTDRFAAAAARCPIVDRISFAGSTDIPGWAFNLFEKPFWEDPAAWLATSPIMQVGKVKTPTLVMVGRNDVRTPVDQAREFFTGLKMARVPTRLLLFNDEGHGTTTKPSNLLRTQLYLRKWYGEWRRVMEGGKATWRHADP